MLSIKRTSLFRNKLFLSSSAGIVGFSMTIGLINSVVPRDNTLEQLVQSDTSGRASLITPINASPSERSSESGNKSDEGSTWKTPATVPGQSSTNVSAQAQSVPADTPETTQATPAVETVSSESSETASSTPEPYAEPEPECVNGTVILGIPIICPDNQ